MFGYLFAWLFYGIFFFRSLGTMAKCYTFSQTCILACMIREQDMVEGRGKKELNRKRDYTKTARICCACQRISLFCINYNVV